MLKLFRAVMPKEVAFFDMFERHSATLVGGSEVMARMFAKEEGIEEACRQISQFEEQADEVTREVLHGVRRTFITPFDRSAITDLISSMDDAIDEMQKTAKAITQFEVVHFEPQMRDMAALAEQGAKLVAEAMPLMRKIASHHSALDKITEQIVHLEEEADHLHDVGPQGAVPQAPRGQCDGLYRRPRDLQPSREGPRPARGRGQRDLRRRHRPRLRSGSMHELALPLLIGLIAIALAFDFLNGLHDAANSIATVVATRLLSPGKAVAFAAFFNFSAYFLALAVPELHKVADTIGKGLIDKDLVTPAVVFGALIGAMFWNVVTWLKGIPSSSSHALVGGLLGSGIAHAGLTGVQWTGLNKTLVAIVLSPTIGMFLALMIMLLTSWLAVRSHPRSAERGFRVLHLISSAGYSIGHGLNDAQKTMGIIAVLLYSTGYLSGEFHVPHWVAISCYVAIGLGTLSGGWRIIKTMGSRITKLSQHQGFSASAGGSVMLFAASWLGIPVSTTHTITGCIIGSGLARRASAVRWGVAQNVVLAWVITIPASATVGAIFYLLTTLF